MLISTRGRYALRMLVDLAQHSEDKLVPLKSIAERQGISEKYLEAILKSLVQARLIEGQRGKGGGYCLSRKPEKITVGEVLRLTEVSLGTASCVSQEAEACPHSVDCPTRPLWLELDAMILGYLDSKTLADLMTGNTFQKKS